MEKEFNLKERQESLMYYLIEQFGKDSIIPRDIMSIVIRNEEEFIKRLKKELKYFEEQYGYLDYDAFKVRIDELAGKELIENGEGK